MTGKSLSFHPFEQREADKQRYFMSPPVFDNPGDFSYHQCLHPQHFLRSSKSQIMLRKLWQEWLRISKHIGSFNARALITLIYFTLLALFGLPARFFSDPLDMKKRPGQSAWLPRATRDLDIDSAKRQG